MLFLKIWQRDGWCRTVVILCPGETNSVLCYGRVGAKRQKNIIED